MVMTETSTETTRVEKPLGYCPYKYDSVRILEGYCTGQDCQMWNAGDCGLKIKRISVTR